MTDQFGNGAGHFDPRGSTPDHRKRDGRVATGDIFLPHGFGAFHCEQQIATDADCIVNRLDAWREFGPMIITEVTMAGARRNHEIVIVDSRAAAQTDFPRIGFNRNQFVHQNADQRRVFDDRTNGCGDVGW